MTTNTPTHILVVEAGWVFAGVLHECDDEFVLTDAVNIRRWGTTRGLGELAMTGPTSETQLDPCGEVRIPTGKVLFLLRITHKGAWR
jgi:hypothetical protein